LDVHTRCRDVGHEAVHRQEPDGDEQLGPQVRYHQSIAKGLEHPYFSSSVTGRTTLPPAAVTASTAPLEAASTLMTRPFTVSSPSARSLTGWSVRRTRPAAVSLAASTVSPSAKPLRSRRLTSCSGSFTRVKPRLGRRM